MSAEISVVIPTYNRAHYLPETLASILAQSLPPREVIVVDDGSTDDTEAVLAPFAGRITCIRIENSGVQAARNIGIARASGSWIALCDSDDLWQPHYLERQMRLIAAAPEIDFVFGNFRILRDGVFEPVSKFERAPEGYWDAVPRRVLPEGWVFKGSLAGQSILFHAIFPSAILFTRALFKAVGGFSPAMRGWRGEDGEFILRCLYRARVGALPEPLVAIRKHDDNDSGDVLRCLVDEVRNLRYVRANHPEAAAYADIIDREILRRSIAAAHLAFAARDHGLVRRLAAAIPPAERPLLLRAKAAVAGLPDPIGLRANGLLQHLGGLRQGAAQGRAAQAARRMRSSEPTMPAASSVSVTASETAGSSLPKNSL